MNTIEPVMLKELKGTDYGSLIKFRVRKILMILFLQKIIMRILLQMKILIQSHLQFLSRMPVILLLREQVLKKWLDIQILIQKRDLLFFKSI